MHRLQEVVRLIRLGRKQRAVGRQLRMGRDTVRLYTKLFAAAGVLHGDPGDLPSEACLQRIVDQAHAAPASGGHPSTVAQWESIVRDLLEKDAGPTAIHDYLRLHHADYEGHLSSIKRLVQRLRKAQPPSAQDIAIPVDTAPGEVAQVDFGYVGMILDEAEGRLRKGWVFVMTLGHSRRSFCQIVFDQRIATWLDLHVQAFDFFGGVPKVIVPDNLKSAVIRAAFGVDDDPIINRSYRELARHFGFQIDPAPPRDPRKKGKVERDVSYVKNNFFKTLETSGIDSDRRQLLPVVRKRGILAIFRALGAPAPLLGADARLSLAPQASSEPAL